MNSNKNYITPGGYKRLVDERDYLQKEGRPEVVKVVSWAASPGDRSENADYQYGKKRLREIDRRMRFLNKRINEAEVVDPELLDGEVIKFGATVNLVDEEGEEKVFTIVGVDEIDTDRGLVSWRSPIGSQLIGKSQGDIASIRTPGGEVEYEVLTVAFKEVKIPEFEKPEADIFEKSEE